MSPLPSMSAGAAVELGITLYRHRLRRGLSLRELAKRLGISGHSGIADYEKGRRIPPADIVGRWERALSLPAGELQRLRDQALAERASKHASMRLAAVEQPAGEFASERAIVHLPPDIPDFIGRESEVATLLDLAKSTDPGHVVIWGQPGVGKTSLAVHTSHLADKGLWNVRLYCDLRGPQTPADPAEALGRMLRALGLAAAAIPGDIEDRSAAFRSALRGRRAILVLDNAASEAQVRPLLPGAGCITIITSQSRLAGLEGVRWMNLPAPTEKTSLAMLSRIIGPERVAAEPHAARSLVNACGRLPLAVRITGNRLTVWPNWSLEYAVRRLARQQRGLTWWKAGDLEVRATFSLAYTCLSSEQRRLFRRLSLIPAPDVGAELAAVVAEVAESEAEQRLEDLAAVSMIQVSDVTGRYRLHNLLQLYARDRLVSEESSNRREMVSRRLVDHVFSTAARAAAAVAPPDQSEIEPGTRFEGHHGDAVRWLDAERFNILGAARMMGGDGVPALLDHLVWYYDLRCHWHDLVEMSELGLAASRRQGDRVREATMLNYRGLALAGLHQYAAGVQAHRQALSLAERASALYEQADSHDKLGVALWGLGRYGEAVPHHRRAGEISRQIADRWGEGAALNHLGHALARSGHLAEAVDCHRQAGALARARGDVRSQAMAMLRLGLTLSRMGRHAEARSCHEGALVDFADADDRWAIGVALHGLAQALAGMGHRAAALDRYYQASDCLRSVGDQLWQARTLVGIGRCMSDANRQGDARAAWEEALVQYKNISSPEAEEVRQLLA